MTTQSSLRSGSLEQSHAASRRMLVRRDSPAGPAGWWVLLPGLGLAAVLAFGMGPFARDGIEGTLRDRARSELQAAGLGWVDVSVSGQQVVLTGAQPEAGAGDKALERVRGLTCSTWLGPLTCPMTVTGLFTGPLPAAATLPGVPSASIPAASMPSMPALPVAAPPGVAGPTAAQQACEKALAEIMAKGRIRFRTASATILEGNEALLDRLARAHQECPGQVAVEGHTDNTGSAATNRALSQARAEAVRQALIARGAPADRLVATGFGKDRPVASNDSPEGRAQNRRIVLRAITSN